MINELNYLLSSALNEDSKNIYKALTKEEVCFQLKHDYSQAYDAFKRGVFLFRGNKRNNAALDYFTTIPGTRVAEDSYNCYTMLTADFLDSWKKYPKRTQSIIFTSSMRAANNYGLVYNIFPINGSPCAISPTTDFWYAYSSTDFFKKHNISALAKFDNTIIETLTILSSAAEATSDMLFSFYHRKIEIERAFTKGDAKSIRRFISMINGSATTDNIIGKASNEIEISEPARYLINKIKNGTDFINIIDKILDPLNIDLKLIDIASITEEDLVGREQRGSEIWTDRPCLSIKEKLLNEVMESMEND